MMHESGAHILVFPFPAQGHMIPLLDFAAQVAALGVTVTVVVTPKNLPSLNRLLAAHPTSIAALVLPFPPSTSIPAGIENIFELPPSAFRFMLHALGQLHEPLLRWFRSQPSPPTAIVSDLFLGWTDHLARQLSIPRYVFCPCGAFAFSVINSLWTEMPKRRNGDDENEIANFPKIPNSPSYPWWQLSPLYRSYVEGDPVSEFIKDSFRANAVSHGLIFNSFTELEGAYLDYLVNELGHDRIWPIGPLLPPNDNGSVDRGGSSSVSVSEIRTWLSTCGDRTVVYACFGSQAMLSNKEMKEVTLGLEKSGVKFILAIKDAIKGYDEEEGGDHGLVPEGFEGRVAGRGLVIKGWAPQVMILQHKAVCAFWTHCGWNSTLESIVGGVPMVAWPMGADQFVNATLLEKEVGIAVGVWEGEIDSDEVARVLGEAAAAAASDKWRGRALAVSRAAQDAIREGGTSFNNFNNFVRGLSHV